MYRIVQKSVKPAVAVDVSVVDADEEVSMIAVKQRRVVVLVPRNWKKIIVSYSGTGISVTEVERSSGCYHHLQIVLFIVLR